VGGGSGHAADRGWRLHPGLIKGDDFGALTVTTGMWQTVLFLVLHGWPLNTIE
jgi:hypothetical protein